MHLSRYAGIESENAERYINANNKQPREYLKHNRYKCTICGEEIMTYVHANKHGYESKDEMINRGLAILISNRKKYKDG